MHDKKHDMTRLDSPVLFLCWDVLEKIIRTIGHMRAESGGPIGGNCLDSVVSRFFFDHSSRNSTATYSPDHKLLNGLFKFQWNPQGIRFRGFVHSHPGFMGRPSYGDKVYAGRILKAIDDLHCLWLPIINTVPDTGVFKLTPWAAYCAERSVSIVRARVQIINAPLQLSLTIYGVEVLESVEPGIPLEEIIIGKQKPVRSLFRLPVANYRNSTDGKIQAPVGGFNLEGLNSNNEAARSFDVSNTFQRVQTAYDLPLMRKTRIIAAGAGGAADWLEAMARAGVEQFVIIDPDVVSESNLATQQTYRKDIGRPKIDCVAARIRDINPNACTVAIQKSLDEMTDDEMRRLVIDPIDGCESGRTILAGLTDNFFAQARVNRLALHLGVPSLCAQVYKEGRAAEITFTYPGVTPACHRCILSSRYRYFLEQGKPNDVTSDGAPIFSTARLNAIKGFVALALVHHGSEHPRWGRMLSRIGKRNLVQLRMDPDLAETLGLKVFDRVFHGADKDKLFFDEVVWLPQDRECPDTGYALCPDCGGTGDLRDSIGKFSDTRLHAKADASLSVVDSSAKSEEKSGNRSLHIEGRAL